MVYGRSFFLLANYRRMSTYLASLIVTATLILPKIAPQSQYQALPFLSPNNQTALQSPKAVVLDIDEYAQKAAQGTGIDSAKFLRLVNCESEWKEDAVGDHNRSFGILQFQKETFARFSKKYDMQSLDISDSYDQIDLAVLMLRDGYEENWFRCSRKIGLLK